MGLHSDNLRYREITAEDLPLLERVFCSESVMHFACDDCYSSQKLGEYMSDILHRNTLVTGRAGYEYLVFRETDFIGFADICIDVKNTAGGIAEIGYFLLPEYQGRGYGTEIARAQVAWCFEELQLHRVHASCHEHNRASQRVMEKAGMTCEGRLVRHRYKHGLWVDELRYAVVRNK